MHELIERIVSKTGIPQDKAEQVLQTVAGFIKEKYPAISGTIDAALGTSGDTKGDSGGRIGNALGGMFGK